MYAVCLSCSQTVCLVRSVTLTQTVFQVCMQPVFPVRRWSVWFVLLSLSSVCACSNGLLKIASPVRWVRRLFDWFVPSSHKHRPFAGLYAVCLSFSQTVCLVRLVCTFHLPTLVGKGLLQIDFSINMVHSQTAVW
jgi:hypothetical protein